MKTTMTAKTRRSGKTGTLRYEASIRSGGFALPPFVSVRATSLNSRRRTRKATENAPIPARSPRDVAVMIVVVVVVTVVIRDLASRVGVNYSHSI